MLLWIWIVLRIHFPAVEGELGGLRGFPGQKPDSGTFSGCAVGQAFLLADLRRWGGQATG